MNDLLIRLALPFFVLVGVVILLGLSWMIKGRSLKKQCGGISGDDSKDCLLCDGKKTPEECAV